MATEYTFTKGTQWNNSAAPINLGRITTQEGSVSKTITIPTNGTYVDRDIVLSVTADAKFGAGSFKANNTTIDVSSNIEIEPTATNGSYSIKVKPTEVTTNSVSTAAGYIANGAAGTSGTATASGTGSVEQSTLKNGSNSIASASTITPAASSQTITIGKGYYPSDRTVNIASVNDGINESVPIAVTSLGENTDSAGENKIILAEGGALKIPAGRIPTDLYYSLAGLVPDNATITPSTASTSILSGETAYDKNGVLLTGAIPKNISDTGELIDGKIVLTPNGKTVTATVAAGYYSAAQTKNVDVQVGSEGIPTASITPSLGNWSYNTTSGKYEATISTSGTTKVINEEGYIAGGTKTGTASATATAILDAAVLTHGGVSGTAGSVSKTVTGINTSATDSGYKVTFSATQGTIKHNASVSAGYTEGDTKEATITATPSKPDDVYFATSSLTRSVSASASGASTGYNAPSTVAASTTVPQLKMTGSVSGATVGNVISAVGSDANKYINYYTGTYTVG